MSPEVIPFARSAQGARYDHNQLDKAGETILQLLNKAADVGAKQQTCDRYGAKALTPASGS
jgi:hypothetical protein